MKVKPSDVARRSLTASGATATVEAPVIVADELATELTEAVETAFSEESDPDPDDDGPEMFRTFTTQAVAPLGVPTSDGRMFAADIDLSFRSTPLPLQWCKQAGIGHMDSYTVGVIEDIKVDGDLVVASGYMLNTTEADEACGLLAHGVSNPSVDLANAEYIFTDRDGNELDEDELWDIMWDGDGEYFITFTKAEVIATTLVSTPAFDTRFSLDAERSSREPAVVASAAETFRPKTYDNRFFADPKLTGPTLPTMGDDGRFYGHLAVFGECHQSIQDACVFAPKARDGYDRFHSSPAVRLSDGTRLPVGRLTVGTGHADHRLGGAPAAAHYDNTGSCFALVRVGEDAHGIWFSGVAAPGATAEQIEQGLSAPLSGDWRDFGRGLELVAALSVNTPGFNVARRARTDGEGKPVALVASGMLSSKVRRGGNPMSRSLFKSLIREAIAEDRKETALAAQRQAAIERARAKAKPAPSKADAVVARAKAVLGRS